MAGYCDTLQPKEKRNWEHKACLNDRALRLLDHELNEQFQHFIAHFIQLLLLFLTFLRRISQMNLERVNS